MVQQVGSSAFGSWGALGVGMFGVLRGMERAKVAQVWGSCSAMCQVHPAQAGAVCPGVELPCPAPMGTGWGNGHGWSSTREQRDQNPGDLGADPLGRWGNLAEPWALQQGAGTRGFLWRDIALLWPAAGPQGAAGAGECLLLTTRPWPGVGCGGSWRQFRWRTRNNLSCNLVF